MDFDNQDIKSFKKVIEDIVDVKLKNEGITKYISAIVTTVNDDNTVDVVIPPDTSKVIRGLYNKTRGDLSVGDSVELCTKNGKLSNAWVSVKHGIQETSASTEALNEYSISDTDAYSCSYVDDKLVKVSSQLDTHFRVNILYNKNIFDGILEQGQYNMANGTKQSSTTLYRCANRIPVSPSTDYTISINGTAHQYLMFYYKQDGSFINYSDNRTGTFTTPNNCFYITFRCYAADYVSNYANLKVQIEQGSSATSYIKFVTPTINVDGKNIANFESAPVGAILPYGGSTAPQDWLICDGRAISRTTYAELFAIIGTSYGSGDGSTTFNLPNLKGKVPVGLNSSDTSFNTLGKTGGEKTHTLTINEIPSHNHQIKTNNDDFNNSSGGGNYGTTHDGTTNWYNTDWYTESAGGGQAHNNLQPYITVNYVIKYTSTHSTIDLPAQVVNQQSSSTTNTYSCQWFNDHSSSISFPKGFIIAMDTNTTPASVFGGTWEKITNRFLYGVDADNKLKTTDGSSTHTHPLEGANAHALVNFTSGRASLAGRGGTGFTATDGTWTSGFTSGQWNDWTADVVGSTNSASTMPPWYGVYYWRKLD